MGCASNDCDPIYKKAVTVLVTAFQSVKEPRQEQTVALLLPRQRTTRNRPSSANKDGDDTTPVRDTVIAPDA